MLGAMAFVKIRKDPHNGSNYALMSAGGITITEAGAIPLVTHYEKNYTGFKVWPLYNYTEELAESHMLNRVKTEMSIASLKNTAARILGDKEITGDPFGPVIPFKR